MADKKNSRLIKKIVGTPQPENFEIQNLANAISSIFKRYFLGRIQDFMKGGSDKRPPKAVAPRRVQGHASPENV